MTIVTLGCQWKVTYLHDCIEILLSIFHSFATSLNLSTFLKSYTIRYWWIIYLVNGRQCNIINTVSHFIMALHKSCKSKTHTLKGEVISQVTAAMHNTNYNNVKNDNMQNKQWTNEWMTETGKRFHYWTYLKNDTNYNIIKYVLFPLFLTMTLSMYCHFSFYNHF